MASRTFHAGNAWFASGWQKNAYFEVDAGQFLGRAATSTQTAHGLGRWVVPGMPNLHSHAFQRASAGLAERRGNPADSFWTWREVMYAFAGKVGPDDLFAIASQLYVEMLKAGYTQVCEFHYLHHQPDGKPYADAAAMSLALIEAAKAAGIGLTLLPTLYMSGGFDGRALVERLRSLENAQLRIGVALHSLRAVPEDAMRAVLEGLDAMAASAHGPADGMPIHIHVAEQIGEVQDCLAVRNARPVEWLLDHAPVNSRWVLIHATHMEDAEMRKLADTGAVVGLCPTTEANLGDGIFPLQRWLELGGNFGIGSDSHISISPVEELRWLEYAQRLIARRRNISANEQQPSTGEVLFANALRGGTLASGLPLGCLGESGLAATGQRHRADLLVLDDSSPLLAGREADNLLDTWLFAGNANLIRDVMVNGQWCVQEFRHRNEEQVANDYRAAITRLTV